MEPCLACCERQKGEGSNTEILLLARRIERYCCRVWCTATRKGNLAKNVAKVGVSVATGTVPLALLNIGAEYAERIFTDDQKRDEFISKAGALLKGTSEAAVINISDSIPPIT